MSSLKPHAPDLVDGHSGDRSNKKQDTGCQSQGTFKAQALQRPREAPWLVTMRLQRPVPRYYTQPIHERFGRIQPVNTLKAIDKMSLKLSGFFRRQPTHQIALKKVELIDELMVHRS
ncbi:MAG: hypothetical protein AABO41_07420 [Acidobacteriota bacterium]